MEPVDYKTAMSHVLTWDERKHCSSEYGYLQLNVQQSFK